MNPMTVPLFQERLAGRLVERFGSAHVEKEWASLSGEDTVYSPRIDIAIGPFAVGTAQLGTTYAAMLDEHRELLSELHVCHHQNVRGLHSSDNAPGLEIAGGRNPNARCFLAIEIENECSRKHILGGLLNASALGRLALAIAWTPEKLRAMLKMRRYLLFLASVGKNALDPSNLLVLSREQIERVLLAPARVRP